MWGYYMRVIIALVVLNASTTRAYRGINIELLEDAEISRKQCREVLTAIESTLTSASAVLHAALDGHYYFEDFNIYLPASWHDDCIPQKQTEPSPYQHNDTQHYLPKPMQRTRSSIGGSSDVIVTNRKGRNGELIWTDQYGPCGTPGLRIFASYDSFKDTQNGKSFIKEWAKYRYGVFDEIGYQDSAIYPKCYRHSGNKLQQTGCTDQAIDEQRENAVCSQEDAEFEVNPVARTSLMFVPEGDSVSMFCDNGNHNRYAPTKHNYMCERRPTLDVIKAHADFAAPKPMPTPQSIVDTTPRFNYRQRTLTRYVVIVDDTLDSSVRESWAFLRSAFRKWIVYDLLDNSEVGVVLASGRNTSKTLNITPLTNDTARDLVASFLPYTPTELRQTICVKCAVAEALKLLDKRQSVMSTTAAHVILIVAPGMAKDESQAEIGRQVASCVNRVALTTINYPTVLAGRQPLDALAERDMGFTVNEDKYNSEKSYLTGYVRLTNVLLHIGGHYFEHAGVHYAPLELHRRVIQHSNELHVQGEFYLDASFGLPAGFFIYTHSVEAPLLQAMRLIAPSGAVVQARSDQRMPVKQITLLTTLNETGRWSYELERYPGNPQPHIVQVLATPRGPTPPITAESRIMQHADYFLLYTALSGGDAVHVNVSVTMTITPRHDGQPNTASTSELRLQLYDDGNGDIDIEAGDGIFSRKLKIRGAGIYSFEFKTSGNAGYAPFHPFTRYSPIYTHHVQSDTMTTATATGTVGRILNFVCRHLAADATLFNCTWSLHDVEHIVGFELRFAYSLEQLLDHFSQADLLTEISQTKDVSSTEQHYSYLHDVSTTPYLFGETIFIALRPKWQQKGLYKPISNIAHVFIETPEQPTIAPTPNSYATNSDDDEVTDVPQTDTNSVGNSATSDKALPFGLSQMGLQVLAACLALLFILIVVLLYACYACNCCCKLAASKKRSSSKLAQYSVEPAAAVTTPEQCVDTGGEVQRVGTTENVNTSLSVLEVKLQDHHRIGIPVFSEPEAEHMHHSNYGLNNSFYNSVHIISPSAFDSADTWYSTQHLLRGPQDMCDAPFDGPPVPPLPYPLLQTGGAETTIYTQQHECDYTLQHHRLPPPPPPPVQHCQQTFDESCALTTTPVADPRRCRNVTMV